MISGTVYNTALQFHRTFADCAFLIVSSALYRLLKEQCRLLNEITTQVSSEPVHWQTYVFRGMRLPTGHHASVVVWMNIAASPPRHMIMNELPTGACLDLASVAASTAPDRERTFDFQILTFRNLKSCFKCYLWHGNCHYYWRKCKGLSFNSHRLRWVFSW